MEWELPLVHTEDEAMPVFPLSQTAAAMEEDGMNDEERRIRRLMRNRESARDSRRRRKQKVHLLESRVAELTAEVNRLRMAAEIASPGFPDNTFTESTLYLCRKLAAALADPQIPDQEIDSILDEFQDMVGATGKSRIETLSKTFDRTMDMMIPMHVKFCLWVCGSDTSCSQPGPPKWEDLVINTSLTPEQIGKFKECQRVFGKEKVELREAFQNLKKMMSRIVRHAKALNSILVELRPLMKPRQVGLLALWLHKHYIGLAAERTANFGCGSTLIKGDALTSLLRECDLRISRGEQSTDSAFAVNVASLSNQQVNGHPQFVELKQRLIDYYKDSVRERPLMHREKSRQWRRVLYTSLQKLLREVVVTQDPVAQLRCLSRVYQWYFDQVQTSHSAATEQSTSPLRATSYMKGTEPQQQKTTSEGLSYTDTGERREPYNDFSSTYIHYRPYAGPSDSASESLFQRIVTDSQNSHRVLRNMRESVFSWTVHKAKHEEELTSRTERGQWVAQARHKSANSLPKIKPRSVTPVVDLTADPKPEEAVEEGKNETLGNDEKGSESPRILRVAKIRKKLEGMIESVDSDEEAVRKFAAGKSERSLLTLHARRSLNTPVPPSLRPTPVPTGGLKMDVRPLSTERAAQMKEIGNVKTKLAKYGVHCKYEEIMAALLVPEDLPQHRLTPNSLPRSELRMMRNPFLHLRDKKKKKRTKKPVS